MTEAYRRFKKQCDRNLIVTETRARRYFGANDRDQKKTKISARKRYVKKIIDMLRRYESRL